MFSYDEAGHMLSALDGVINETLETIKKDLSEAISSKDVDEQVLSVALAAKEYKEFTLSLLDKLAKATDDKEAKKKIKKYAKNFSASLVIKAKACPQNHSEQLTKNKSQ